VVDLPSQVDQLPRLIDPSSIAIAGLSADAGKHGGRVLRHLRALGYEGDVWGVNPGLPTVHGIDMYPTIGALPRPPDLVVCAVPASSVTGVVAQCSGVGAIVVFASGFSETGPTGQAIQETMSEEATRVGVRVLGPNSGGVIRPGRRLAASFLTCLDRPPAEVRTGPVGVLTQSGGVGSYVHNLAAEHSGGVAISVSTGNECDVTLGEALESVARLDEVLALLVLIETVRAGSEFMRALEVARSLGKPVIACRLGATDRGKTMMKTHTGAMAIPEAVLSGVLASMGVTVAETPGEAYEVAEMLARAPARDGARSAIVTHSGGMAVFLADLADRHHLDLPPPSKELKMRLEPMLDHGVASNPVDIGGIIGGPTRFARVIDVVASSGEYDSVLSVSSAHPPGHTQARVASLMGLVTETRILHLWMTGGQGREGLRTLREYGAPVTEDPRAAIRALAAPRPRDPRAENLQPMPGGLETWGLPLIETRSVSTVEEAADAAEMFGYPVVLKVEAAGLVHKTQHDGVRLDLRDREAVVAAFREVVTSANLDVRSACVQRYRPGLEMILGVVVDDLFGPLVSVGLGGVLTELLNDVVFAPAPVDQTMAQAMIDRLKGRRFLDGSRAAPVDVTELARLVSLISRGFVCSDLHEVEINPLIWDGKEWIAVDWISLARIETAGIHGRRKNRQVIH